MTWKGQIRYSLWWHKCVIYLSELKRCKMGRTRVLGMVITGNASAEINQCPRAKTSHCRRLVHHWMSDVQCSIGQPPRFNGFSLIGSNFSPGRWSKLFLLGVASRFECPDSMTSLPCGQHWLARYRWLIRTIAAQPAAPSTSHLWLIGTQNGGSSRHSPSSPTLIQPSNEAASSGWSKTTHSIGFPHEVVTRLSGVAGTKQCRTHTPASPFNSTLHTATQ